MQHDNMEADEYDESHEHQGNNPVLSWFKQRFTRGADDLETYEEDDDIVDSDSVARLPHPARAAGGSNAPLRRGTGSTLRLETARRSKVTVRRTVQSFEDVKRAVDGLRDGTQQIVNLEQTASDMAARLIDFLNGATYAIDGSVEKIGEHVYLFTPANVTVDIDDRAAVGSRTPFFDK
jgi:cell division inhibitor SepF